MPRMPHTSARVKLERRERRQLHQIEGRRPRKREHRHVGRAIVEDHPVPRLAGQPVAVVVDTGRVDDKQEMVVVEPVGDQVVDRAAALVEEEGVLRLADVDAAQVVREHRLEGLQRGGAAHLELAHVAHVEDARVLDERHGALGTTPLYCTGISATRQTEPSAPRLPGADRGAVYGGGPRKRAHPEAQSIHAFPGSSAFRYRRCVKRSGASSNPSAR